MLISVELINFRNYENKKFEFGDGINVFFGENGAGKTNLLEAIYMIGCGESIRARRTEEMIHFEVEYGQIKVGVRVGDELMTQEIVISNGTMLGRRIAKRKYLINGAPKRKQDFIGYEKMVIFRPEDVEMISGQPGMRRKFLDLVLLQTSKGYRGTVSSYEDVLKKRNKILSQIKDGMGSAYSLKFWDGLLIKYAGIIQSERENLISFMNDLLARSEMFGDLKVSYEKSVVTEQKLLEKQEVEKIVGYTLMGAHKDDWMIFKNDKPLDAFGSRGEQRMSVLGLKMGELYFLENFSKQKALLLLDDVFSELDDTHRTEVLRLMQDRQVIATTANQEDVILFGKERVFSV